MDGLQGSQESISDITYVTWNVFSRRYGRGRGRHRGCCSRQEVARLRLPAQDPEAGPRERDRLHHQAAARLEVQCRVCLSDRSVLVILLDGSQVRC